MDCLHIFPPRELYHIEAQGRKGRTLKKYITKADIILLVVLVVVGIASSVYFAVSRSAGERVIIESDGELYARYSLNEDQRIEVKNGNKVNIVVIEGGEVYVEEASCKNQVCVDTGRIDQAGESIICLPNKLVVRIEGKGDKKYDAVSN